MTEFHLSDGRTLSKAETLQAVRNKNSQVIKDITTQSFAEGGLLNRQQFATFYQEVQDEAQLLDRVRFEPLSGPEYQIDRIGIGEFNLRGVGEGDRADLRDIETGQIDIDVVKTSLPFELTRETIEDTLEYENTAEIILSKFTQAYAFETEYLGWQGDTDYVDADPGDEPEGFKSINDGWFKIAEERGSPTVDAGATTLDEGHLFDATYAMEDMFLRASDPLFVCHPKQAIAYREALSDRQTMLGDEMLTTGQMPTPTGYNIAVSSALPIDQAMFTDLSNLIYAVHRDMRVSVTTESEAVVMNDLFAQYNLTSRFDYQIEDEDGVVVIDNLADPVA